MKSLCRLFLSGQWEHVVKLIVRRPLSGTAHTRREFPNAISVLGLMQSVSEEQMKFFFDSRKLYYEQGYTCLITTCPALLKAHLNSEEMDKIFVNKNTGDYVCHACNSEGQWVKLQNNIIAQLDSPDRKQSQSCTCLLKEEHRSEAYRVNGQTNAILSTCKHISEMKFIRTLLARFGIKDLNSTTLAKYDVRVSDNDLVFPYYNHLKEIQGVKTVTALKRGAIEEKWFPTNKFNGLFGWNYVRRDMAEVILTTSEFDAMIAHQETKLPSLSLAKGPTALHPDVLPLLEQFHKIILWFGNDVRSWETSKQFAKKLNPDRCYVLGPGKDVPCALSAKKKGIPLNEVITQAIPLRSKAITSFQELRKEVFSELSHADQVAGVKWLRYPALNKLLKGHRRGELSVFTGPTGSGKTTFMSEYSLDLCLQGVQTLWGSFELKNVRLMKMMLAQYSMKNLSKHMDEFDYWANKFEELPMYFMTFHGQENISKVIETMSHAVYMYDISNVVVDNLQFMMGVDPGNRVFLDRFSKQDQIIGAFRKFATIMNCHVTLVIHPRKEEDGTELTVSSIFGGAKASQEADNIMILQNNRSGKKYLQIVKNRFDGDLGAMLLKFDKDSLTFSRDIVSKSKKLKTDYSKVLPEGEKTVSESVIDSKHTEETTKETIKLL